MSRCPTQSGGFEIETGEFVERFDDGSAYVRNRRVIIDGSSIEWIYDDDDMYVDDGMVLYQPGPEFFNKFCEWQSRLRSHKWKLWNANTEGRALPKLKIQVRFDQNIIEIILVNLYRMIDDVLRPRSSAESAQYYDMIIDYAVESAKKIGVLVPSSPELDVDENVIRDTGWLGPDENIPAGGPVGNIGRQ